MSSDSRSENTAYLQKRVALFARVWTYINLLGLAIRLGTIFLVARLVDGERMDAMWGTPVQLHVASTIAVAAMWAFNAVGERARATIVASETIGLTAYAALLSAMGAELVRVIAFDAASAGAPLGQVGMSMTHAYGALIVIFILVGGLILRAALVPGNVRRTTALSAWLGAVTVSAFIAILATRHIAKDYLVAVAVGGGAFWCVGLAIVVAVSHIVHGLREQVRTAERLGQYTLEEKLGEGGMGIVFRARHAMLRRPTAIKLLPPEKVAERAVQRFEREVQRTAQLTHPNTVTVFDYGRTPEGIFYYAMELLDGATVEDVVDATGPQCPARVVHVGLGVCGALAEAHAMGLVHRDIKPANIILARQGGRVDVPKVVDFGLVEQIDRKGAESTAETTLTGTPLYMAPELIRAPEEADGRADLYALGAVLYFMLCGETVFTGRTIVEICAHHLHTPPPSLGERDLVCPPKLEALVLSCLAKDPDDRPDSADALLRALLALDVPSWTEENAKAWWREHGEALPGGSAQPSTGAGTMTVDVAMR